MEIRLEYELEQMGYHCITIIYNIYIYINIFITTCILGTKTDGYFSTTSAIFFGIF